MYISFESLLLTNRAVKRRGNWLVVQTAGDNPTKYNFEFSDNTTAKRAGGSLLVHMREKRAAGTCNTDPMYNSIIFNWLERLLAGGYIQNVRENDDESSSTEDRSNQS